MSDENTEIHRPYDQAYYEEFNAPATYDVLRPLRRMMRRNYMLLPSDATAAIFSVSSLENFAKKWPRVFTRTVGYDVNAHLVALAQERGLSIYEQDVTVPFKPVKSTVAICHYLFEHLTDHQVVGVIDNMVAHAPINIIQLTDVDDEHYPMDPTHLNPKTIREWGQFLRIFYEEHGYKFLKSGGPSWCFVKPEVKAIFTGIERSLTAYVDNAWAKAGVL